MSNNQFKILSLCNIPVAPNKKAIAKTWQSPRTSTTVSSLNLKVLRDTTVEQILTISFFNFLIIKISQMYVFIF
jgi:hypothetical protein